jgi:hypothetical protein
MKRLPGLGLLCSFGLLTVPVAGAEERIDTSHIMVKKGIADKMTPAELQAYKERLARNLASRRSEWTAPAGDPDTPADACPAATPESGALPFGPVSDTTVGMTDDYDLPADTANPTCTASTTCIGGGPVGAQPRGGIYTGTGVGPDRAYRFKTDANCDLTITMDPTGAEDLALFVYQAQCSNSLADCVCVDDDGIGGVAESVLLSAVAATEYFVVVDGYSTGAAPPGPSGPFDLTITGTGCNLLPGGTYHTITPCRLIDTRNLPNGPYAGPALIAGAERPFDAPGGACGIPATATALFLNVTVISPTNNGFLQIYPTAGMPPTVSAVNYSAGQVRGNNGVFGLDATGQFYIRLGQGAGSAHVVVDVAGYFEE